MIASASRLASQQQLPIVLHNARYASGPQTSAFASIYIEDGRITRITRESSPSQRSASASTEINLRGFFLMPGLINAHDHLEFALFPRLADPPYRNYIEWGEDIHQKFPDVIAKQRSVPKPVRLWWGGIRNLLCGVTTVAHHNPLWPILESEDFPVHVVRKYGWGHSLALGGDLRAARANTPAEYPFIVHACEGVDGQARQELWELDRLGLLEARTILVHGLAIDQSGAALLHERRTSLVVCPSSNHFLFDTLPDLSQLERIENLTLGNDSPLTAEGDLLDEIRFALRFCEISPPVVYDMVTAAPATLLRLKDAEGFIDNSGVADLIAVRDTSREAADTLATLSANDIELVISRGRVQLASNDILEQLPLAAKQDLEPLFMDGAMRWLRAPVRKLFHATTQILGEDMLRLGSREVHAPHSVESEYVF
jgi:hypothetical protein